jgi:hypothetical protein
MARSFTNNENKITHENYKSAITLIEFPLPSLLHSVTDAHLSSHLDAKKTQLSFF